MPIGCVYLPRDDALYYRLAECEKHRKSLAFNHQEQAVFSSLY